MIPDYQTLMRPVLECASSAEARIGDVVEQLAKRLGLAAEDRAAILPSGKQPRFVNRVNRAKSYLKQGGLVEITGRGRFKSLTADVMHWLIRLRRSIAHTGRSSKSSNFNSREGDADIIMPAPQGPPETDSTPDEPLRRAHGAIIGALSSELLHRVRNGTPEFFEH